MGSSASKPARSAAQAASRRQYPKQPAAPSPATASQSPAANAPRRPPPPAPSPASREPNIPPQTPAQGPTYHSKEKASTEKSSAIDLDGRDPHFAASLRSIGAVKPSPTFSHSSTFNQTQQGQDHHPVQPHSPTVFPTASNPALLVVTARQRATREAESEAEEMGRGGFSGRRYLDALTIRQALAMRDRQGLPEGEIERTLRLKQGAVGRIGGRNGVFGVP
ncbi:uncharacterized protein APUU_21440S [Aspergillus puulaauensis]|uniref:Helix-turn-helix domain-containing protein n=1 Tax=Aspergillus puulaauensis TaxID=1220207 RepID=A0A7R8AKZ7_9EURO|nr:uncharacterized protein APUU_21440S [Aspergillus puulaauensis]BCS21008.1 hypothetical protein APUU_21440S [Aspergillus puulaauensis]